MRDYINIVQPLLEATAEPTVDELESIKSVLAGKIKDLPNDAATAKLLHDIEDLLSHMHAGGKTGIITTKLDQINDPTVTAAQKLLARYLISLEMSPKQRDELFSAWRDDTLVDRKLLISPGVRTIADVVHNYTTNPVISEFVNDLMKIQALGQGKGEFALSVLSKSISKPDKGDLLVDGVKVEVKTTDGGAGRFTDQEVRPGPGYENAARVLNAFIQEHPAIMQELPASGLNLSTAVRIAQTIDNVDEFITLCNDVMSIIFNGTENTSVDKVCQAIKNGNEKVALQEYAKASFNYYMSMKDDDGVLYIDLTQSPIKLIYFRDVDDLSKYAMRLHAKTVYITSIADVRLPYPQMEVLPTSFGANAVALAAKQAAKQEKINAKLAKMNSPIPDIRPTAAAAMRDKRNMGPGREKR